ncbi:hypothetical protein KIF24_24865 [Micromonospora sp. Llam7]|uniref:hypothetical protein n=1 Tax=Micromonospora tarapacensis TaxID=2835305 RepID=UPI001C838F3E|nr:hypothetical protein [Micromonospora tarapacensis]MBX7268945.1 hypothetical protein [Micromonospora tarapacensis]
MSRPRFQHAAPRRRIRPLAITTAGLALLVLASLAVARSSDNPSHQQTLPEQQLVTVHPPAADQASPVPQQVAVDFAWPTDLTWINVAGLDLPVSATAGPRDLADGRARSFAHTLSGAVLATLHLLVRTSPQVGPRVWEPTLREQVVGPDVAAYVDAVAQDYAVAREQLQIPYGDPLAPIYASIAGVRIDSYHPQAVGLRLLIEAPDGDGGVARAATIVQVSWSGTDWQLIAPPRGDWSTVRALVGPAVVRGYTPLPGR